MRVPLPVVVVVVADPQGDRDRPILPRQKEKPIFFKNQRKKMNPFLSLRKRKKSPTRRFFSILGDLIAMAASSIFFGRKRRKTEKNAPDGYFFGVVSIFCGASLRYPKTPDGLAPPMAPFSRARTQRGRDHGAGGGGRPGGEKGKGRKEPQRPHNGRRWRI